MLAGIGHTHYWAGAGGGGPTPTTYREGTNAAEIGGNPNQTVRSQIRSASVLLFLFSTLEWIRGFYEPS